MELSPLQRRVIQLLLRRGTTLESELRRLIRMLPDGDHLSPVEFDTLLDVLEHAGWLIKKTDGDEPRYRVQFAQKTPRSSTTIWDRLKLDNLRQRWQIRLTSLGETAQARTPPPPDTPGDEPAKEDLLMRRGGKRALPQAIWDRLEETPSGETAASDTETKPRSAGLLDALNQPKEKPSSDKQDIRKKLWDALGDDGE
jgi:hypothetical protein